MARLGRTAMVAAGLLVAGGCTILLGENKDFHAVGTGGSSGTTDNSSGTTSTTGASSTTSGTSSSTTTNSSTTSSSGTGGGGSCMVQHAGGGTCEYLPGHECGCSGSMKCSVVDEATGRSGCILSGPATSFHQCGVDADCAAGLWCNHSTQACQPICQNTADCAAQGGLCEPALQLGSTLPIAGLDVCAAHCNLPTAAPCGAGLTCVYQPNPKEFECTVSGGAGAQKACSRDADCAPTLGCFDDGLGMFRCFPWCTPTGQSCAGGGFCYALNPAVVRGATSYGTCQ